MMGKKAGLVIIIVIIIFVAIFITIFMNPRIMGGNVIRDSAQEIAQLKQKDLDLQNTIESIQKNETDLRQEIDILSEKLINISKLSENIKRYIQKEQTVTFEFGNKTSVVVSNGITPIGGVSTYYSIDCCILGCNLKKNNIDNDCDTWGCYHSKKDEFEPCQETKDGFCICEKFQVECICVF